MENRDTNDNYNVVFQYTAAAGSHEGVITWSCFKNAEDFKRFYTPEIKKRERVLAKGVTSDEAVEYCEKTPLACHISAAVGKARNPKTKGLDDFILGQEFFQIALAELDTNPPQL